MEKRISTMDRLAEQAQKHNETQTAFARALGLVLEFLDEHPEFDEEERRVLGRTNRRGCWCRIAVVPGGGLPFEIARFLFGLVNPAKDRKYCALSGEKWRRLGKRPGDLSSYQTRDPNAKLGIESGDERWGQWGGAVRATHSIFSVSGLSEIADEAVAALAALFCHELDDGGVEAIFNASNNQLGRAVHSLVKSRRDEPAAG